MNLQIGNAAETYRHQGYVILPGALEDADVNTLRESCDTLLAEPPENDIKGMSHNIGRGADRRFLRRRHEDFPALEALIMGPEMKALVANFIGPTPHLFNEQFVVKGPRTGASFAWHQDSAYVGFDHRPYLTVWMALDDTTTENGAVYVLPKNLNDDETITEHEWDEAGKELVGYHGEDPGQAATVAAGSLVLFSSVTLHRSSPNITDKPRRGYIAQYTCEPLLDPETGEPKTLAKPL